MFPTPALVALALVIVFVRASPAAKTRKEYVRAGDDAVYKKDLSVALSMFTSRPQLGKRPQSPRKTRESQRKAPQTRGGRRRPRARLEARSLLLPGARVPRVPCTSRSSGCVRRLWKTFGPCSPFKATHGDAKKLVVKAVECEGLLASARESFARGEHEAALGALRRLTDEIGITGPGITKLRARVRYAAGDFFECIADAGDVVKRDRTDVEALLLRGRAYYRTGDNEMTLRHLESALKVDPEHEETVEFSRNIKRLTEAFDRAESLLNRHTTDSMMEALTLYDEVLTIDPDPRRLQQDRAPAAVQDSYETEEKGRCSRSVQRRDPHRQIAERGSDTVW